MASGLASLKAFITSWPYRSPGWICILFTGVFSLIWYLDLWRVHPRLDREEEESLRANFEDVPAIQWRLIVALLVLTILPAAIFVFAEIFRETKPDGSNQDKSESENLAEGFSLLALVLCWIPSIMWVTIPKGAASLIGNAYFSSWLLVIFIAETGVWFVHDLRERIHQSLEQKQLEYREKQLQVLEKAQFLKKEKATDSAAQPAMPMGRKDSLVLDESFVDVDDENGDDEDDSSADYLEALTD